MERQKYRPPYVKLAVALLTLLCMGYLGLPYFGELQRIREARLSGLVAIAAIHALTLWFQGITLKISLVPFGNRISCMQGFAMSVMSSYANLLLPRSGIAATAAYLNRQCRTKLVDFSSIVLYNAGLFVLCSACIATLLSLAYAFAPRVDVQSWLLPSLVFLTLAAWFSVHVRWRVPASYRGVGSLTLGKLCHASAQLRTGRCFWPLTRLHVLLTLMRAARLYVAFWALAIDVNPWGVLLASALGDLVFIFAITPAALGFREAAITFSAGAMSTTASLALSVAIFDRLVFSGTVIVLAQLVLSCLLGRQAHSGQLPSGSIPLASDASSGSSCKQSSW